MTDHAKEAIYLMNEARNATRRDAIERYRFEAHVHSHLAIADAIRATAPKPVQFKPSAPIFTFADRWPNGKPDPCSACWQRHDPGPCPEPEAQRAAWAEVTKAVQDATGAPHSDEQAEPGQVDTPGNGKATDAPQCDGRDHHPNHGSPWGPIAGSVCTWNHPALGNITLGNNHCRLTDGHPGPHCLSNYAAWRTTQARAEKAEAERDHLVGVIDGAEQRTRMAEAERDAILADLRVFIPTMPAGIMASLDYPRNEIQAIIDRHTPEG